MTYLPLNVIGYNYIHDSWRAAPMTKTRAEIFVVLDELSELFPEFRFGQMVVNLSSLARDFTNEAIYDVEDEEFLEAARDFLVHRRAALEESPPGSVPASTSLPSVVTPDDRSPTNT
jgi:hypothetical protein